MAVKSAILNKWQSLKGELRPILSSFIRYLRRIDGLKFLVSSATYEEDKPLPQRMKVKILHVHLSLLIFVFLLLYSCGCCSFYLIPSFITFAYHSRFTQSTLADGQQQYKTITKSSS